MHPSSLEFKKKKQKTFVVTEVECSDVHENRLGTSQYFPGCRFCEVGGKLHMGEPDPQFA